VSDAKALMDVKLLKPVANGTDLLVKIEAGSVNPINNEPKILGWDAVGVGESIGDQVSMFKEGDKVWIASALNR
jgi:NADPH2:quinone reductase